MAATKDKPKKTDDFKTVMIEVPMTLDPPPARFPVHIDIRLDITQSTTLRRIARELDCQGETLVSGRRVTEVSHAVKWLLEKLAKSVTD